MASESNDIDRDKLRAAVRKLRNKYILYMLDDAIDLLPPAKLHQLARKYLDLERQGLPQATRPATCNRIARRAKPAKRARWPGEKG